MDPMGYCTTPYLGPAVDVAPKYGHPWLSKRPALHCALVSAAQPRPKPVKPRSLKLCLHVSPPKLHVESKNQCTSEARTRHDATDSCLTCLTWNCMCQMWFHVISNANGSRLVHIAQLVVLRSTWLERILESEKSQRQVNKFTKVCLLFLLEDVDCFLGKDCPMWCLQLV
jgi:hypothetical protein